jgi:hypothetical protein
MTNLDVKNVNSLIKEAIKNGDLNSDSKLALNTHLYSCSLVVGALKGQLYAFFYKKENDWIETMLLHAVYFIKKMRANCGDSKAAISLGIIEEQLFDDELNDEYFLLEVGAFKNPFDLRADELPMFYSL